MNLLSSSLVAHPGATLSTLTPDRREKEDVIRVSRQRPVLRACSGLVLGTIIQWPVIILPIATFPPS
ncbi:hypothetical protein EV401DRAFT_2048613 [Pisolithus croceorrhizus]|nr:hypothetical protein EV401DRAFT_2048613 [Pisolithus croceorrhizus]